MNTRNEQEQVYAVSQLTGDIKRMLTVQFKEFIHHIEDHEESVVVTRMTPLGNVTWISMFDRYKIA